AVSISTNLKQTVKFPFKYSKINNHRSFVRFCPHSTSSNLLTISSPNSLNFSISTFCLQNLSVILCSRSIRFQIGSLPGRSCSRSCTISAIFPLRSNLFSSFSSCILNLSVRTATESVSNIILSLRLWFSSFSSDISSNNPSTFFSIPFSFCRTIGNENGHPIPFNDLRRS
ncbi:hypothetical protein PFISCL1PPCAC_6719, partial [Pristionchus fissidentatus]